MCMCRKTEDGSTRAYLGYDDDIYPSPCLNHDDYHDSLTGPCPHRLRFDFDDTTIDDDECQFGPQYPEECSHRRIVGMQSRPIIISLSRTENFLARSDLARSQISFQISEELAFSVILIRSAECCCCRFSSLTSTLNIHMASIAAQLLIMSKHHGPHTLDHPCTNVDVMSMVRMHLRCKNKHSPVFKPHYLIVMSHTQRPRES